MKTHKLVGPLLLGSFVLTGAASAQAEATHSTGAATGPRVVHTIVTMRHVGARTTHTAVVAPSAAEASSTASNTETTTRPPRLPAVHFRH
jgi:hypothetical protein